MYIYKRKSKTVKRTAIAVVILLFLAIAGGAIYVYISDRNPIRPVSAADAKAQEPTFVPKTTLPAANAKEGVAVESLLTPVSAGMNTSIAIATNARSTCTINVSYNNVPSKDSGLVQKTADDHGSVSWTWTVDKTAPLGKWPVKVTCIYNGRSGVVVGDLEVTK